MNFQKFLETPIEVFWYLTSRCNLSCGFCLENSLPASSDELVSEETRQTILREIVNCQVLKVGISGGEPFLLPKLDQYVEFLAREGIFVTITSNGLLVTEGIAARIAQAGVRAIEITIYPEAQSQSFRAIKLLTEAGIQVKPRAVLTRHLCGNLRGFLQDCLANGIHDLAMQEVGLVGRALNTPHKFTLTLKELMTASEVIASFHKEQDDLIVSFVSTTLTKDEDSPPVLCDATSQNRKRCEIRPDGNVIPCSKVLIYNINNNLVGKGLKKAWEDIPELYEEPLKSSVSYACSNCLKIDHCPHGCPPDHEKNKKSGPYTSDEFCSSFKGH